MLTHQSYFLMMEGSSYLPDTGGSPERKDDEVQEASTAAFRNSSQRRGLMTPAEEPAASSAVDRGGSAVHTPATGSSSKNGHRSFLESGDGSIRVDPPLEGASNVEDHFPMNRQRNDSRASTSTSTPSASTRHGRNVLNFQKYRASKRNAESVERGYAGEEIRNGQKKKHGENIRPSDRLSNLTTKRIVPSQPASVPWHWNAATESGGLVPDLQARSVLHEWLDALNSEVVSLIPDVDEAKRSLLEADTLAKAALVQEQKERRRRFLVEREEKRAEDAKTREKWNEESIHFMNTAIANGSATDGDLEDLLGEIVDMEKQVKYQQKAEDYFENEEWMELNKRMDKELKMLVYAIAQPSNVLKLAKLKVGEANAAQHGTTNGTLLTGDKEAISTREEQENDELANALDYDFDDDEEEDDTDVSDFEEECYSAQHYEGFTSRTTDSIRQLPESSISPETQEVPVGAQLNPVFPFELFPLALSNRDIKMHVENVFGDKAKMISNPKIEPVQKAKRKKASKLAPSVRGASYALISDATQKIMFDLEEIGVLTPADRLGGSDLDHLVVSAKPMLPPPHTIQAAYVCDQMIHFANKTENGRLGMLIGPLTRELFGSIYRGYKGNRYNEGHSAGEGICTSNEKAVVPFFQLTRVHDLQYRDYCFRLVSYGKKVRAIKRQALFSLQMLADADKRAAKPRMILLFRQWKANVQRTRNMRKVFARIGAEGHVASRRNKLISTFQQWRITVSQVRRETIQAKYDLVLEKYRSYLAETEHLRSVCTAQVGKEEEAVGKVSALLKTIHEKGDVLEAVLTELHAKIDAFDILREKAVYGVLAMLQGVRFLQSTLKMVAQSCPQDISGVFKEMLCSPNKSRNEPELRDDNTREALERLKKCLAEEEKAGVATKNKTTGTWETGVGTADWLKARTNCSRAMAHYLTFLKEEDILIMWVNSHLFSIQTDVVAQYYDQSQNEDSVDKAVSSKGASSTRVRAPAKHKEVSKYDLPVPAHLKVYTRRLENFAGHLGDGAILCRLIAYMFPHLKSKCDTIMEEFDLDLRLRKFLKLYASHIDPNFASLLTSQSLISSNFPDIAAAVVGNLMVKVPCLPFSHDWFTPFDSSLNMFPLGEGNLSEDRSADAPPGFPAPDVQCRMLNQLDALAYRLNSYLYTLQNAGIGEGFIHVQNAAPLVTENYGKYEDEVKRTIGRVRNILQDVDDRSPVWISLKQRMQVYIIKILSARTHNSKVLLAKKAAATAKKQKAVRARHLAAVSTTARAGPENVLSASVPMKDLIRVVDHVFENKREKETSLLMPLTALNKALAPADLSKMVSPRGRRKVNAGEEGDSPRGVEEQLIKLVPDDSDAFIPAFPYLDFPYQDLQLHAPELAMFKEKADAAQTAIKVSFNTSLCRKKPKGVSFQPRSFETVDGATRLHECAKETARNLARVTNMLLHFYSAIGDIFRFYAASTDGESVEAQSSMSSQEFWAFAKECDVSRLGLSKDQIMSIYEEVVLLEDNQVPKYLVIVPTAAAKESKDAAGGDSGADSKKKAGSKAKAGASGATREMNLHLFVVALVRLAHASWPSKVDGIVAQAHWKSMQTLGAVYAQLTRPRPLSIRELAVHQAQARYQAIASLSLTQMKELVSSAAQLIDAENGKAGKKKGMNEESGTEDAENEVKEATEVEVDDEKAEEVKAQFISGAKERLEMAAMMAGLDVGAFDATGSGDLIEDRADSTLDAWEPTQLSLWQRFWCMMNNYVIPKTSRMDSVSFRKEFQSSLVTSLLQQYEQPLHHVFGEFAKMYRKKSPKNGTTVLGPGTFVDMLKDAGWIDQHISLEEAGKIFIMAQQDLDRREIDDDETDKKKSSASNVDNEMIYQEWLEALAIICVYRFPDPNSPLASKLSSFLEVDFLPLAINKGWKRKDTAKK